jgi:predicted nucleotidyltransferase
MPDARASGVRDALVGAAGRTPGLELLLLYGSRARGEAHARSDWDLGYLAAPETDIGGLTAAVVEIAGTDRVDLVDLTCAGGLLRYRAARDGELIYEARPGLDERFRFEAVRFWCEAGPLLRRGYADVLADLKL